MFKSRGDIVYKCTVRLLEDTEILECEFHPNDKGKYLLEYVCQQLNLTETDYFGLRYVDASGQRHWLHLAKLILKQVKDASPILFSFRVKFYPPAPGVLAAGARWQLCLQLRRDLLHARLAPTPPESALLAALVVQMELGDYDPAIHVGNYVSEMRLLLRQTDAIEARIQELHRTPAEGTEGAEGGGGGGAGGYGVRGLSAEEAERAFLKLACQLDTYGLDPHPVKDGRGQQVWVGAGHAGLVVLSAGHRLHHFRWADVHKINFEGRMFIVHLNYPEKKHTVGFKCPSGAACRHLWCCAIEQMLFFTLPSSSEASVYSGGGLFSWGTKFKYSGRTERELLARDSHSQDENGSVPSSGAGGRPRRKASSVPATPSTPMTNDFVGAGYSSLPRSAHSAPLEEGGGGGCAGDAGEAGGGCLLAAGPGGDAPDATAATTAASALPDDRPGVVSWPCGGEEVGACSHSSTESGGGAGGAPAGEGGGAAAGMGSTTGEGGVGARRFSWARALVPALALSVAALGALLVLVLEGGLASDWDWEWEWAWGLAAADLRALKHLYYAPLRDYLRRRLIDLF